MQIDKKFDIPSGTMTIEQKSKPITKNSHHTALSKLEKNRKEMKPMSNIIYTAFVTRTPDYSSTDDLCTAFNCSKRTIARRIEELEKETERYGNHVVIRDGRIILVNYLAFVDYMVYRQKLMQPNLRKYVPEYNPRAIEQELGRKPEVEAM